jgi:hypothetical protein
MSSGIWLSGTTIRRIATIPRDGTVGADAVTGTTGGSFADIAVDRDQTKS